MDLGLDRIKSLLKALGNPERSFRVVHVAGTNGKGSVCAYIASILGAAGFTVGRYNSPHFITPSDATQICGKCLDAEDYEKLICRVSTVDKKNNFNASSFEITTAAALLWFYESHVDIAVIEVGLGGTLDATNVFDHPAVSVITPIGMDHAGILGTTIEEIAGAKAGIMKSQCPVVISSQTESQAMNVLNARAHQLSCPVILSPTAAWTSNSSEPAWATVKVSGPDNAMGETYQFKIPLYGDHQLVNAATAVSTIHMLKCTSKEFGEKISLQHIQEGMAKTRWRGRLDLLTKYDHPWLKSVYNIEEMFVDGAHNQPAALVLRQFVDQQLKARSLERVHWIVASTQGKDLIKLLSILLRPQDSISATTFTQPENMPWIYPMPQSDIITVANSITKDCTIENSLDTALHTAGKLDPSKQLIVLCGSLYLVADLYRLPC
jgi:folylpolyglutamate synthase/dihydrofolate synthase